MKKSAKIGLNINAKDIAKITKGKLAGDGNIVVDSISTDSRTIKEGELFVALKGELFDGHNYIAKALERGACGAIVKKGFKMKDKMKQQSLFIEVNDTLDAYQNIAAYNRSKNKAKVVAITGSSGKTTTKEMLRGIIVATKKNVVVSEKNFNNQIGVPMTLLNIKDGDEIAVLEVGISELNDMESLARITNPDIALVTNAGSSHLEFFKNVETVANEKMKLADGLKPGGLLIFNCDDLRLFKNARIKNVKTLTFGFSSSADIMGEAFRDISLGKSRLKVKIKGEEKSINIPLVINGKHNAYNALAAIAVAWTLSIPMKDIIKGLKTFQPKDMRSENIFLNRDIVLINDAYNANPDSMKASLSLFRDLKGAPRKIAVLGDMYELGEYSPRAHREVGAVAYNFKIDLLFLYGNEMREAARSAEYCGMPKRNIYWHDDMDSLLKSLLANIKDGDWIMVKGSRLNKLETVVEMLAREVGISNKKEGRSH